MVNPFELFLRQQRLMLDRLRLHIDFYLFRYLFHYIRPNKRRIIRYSVTLRVDTHMATFLFLWLFLRILIKLITKYLFFLIYPIYDFDYIGLYSLIEFVQQLLCLIINLILYIDRHRW